MVGFRTFLASLAFLWIGLGQVVSAAAQTAIKPSDIGGAYNCSAPGSTPLQKLILLSGGRWIKGPFFDHAAFKIRWGSVQTGSYHGKMVFLERDPKLQGQFRVKKDHVVLYSLQPGVLHSGLWGLLEPLVPDAMLILEQRFRIDSASHDLIEVLPFNAVRAPLTCTKDGFF